MRDGPDFQAALAHAPVVVWHQDRDLRYTRFYDPRGAFRSEEILGKRDRDLTDPASAARLEAVKRRVLETGQPAREEMPLEFLGRPEVLDLYFEPLRDEAGGIIGIAGAAIDITDRKKAEAALRQSEVHFRMLAEAIPNFVWVASADGGIEHLSPQFLEYVGMGPETFLGSGWKNAIHPDDVERSAAEWACCVATGRTYEIEHRARRRDGQYRWLLSRAVPICDAEGRVSKWIGSTTDIEEQKRVEAALAAALEKQSALLHQNELLLREIDHRVYNSLSLIRSLLRLYSSGLSDPAAQTALAEAASRVQTIARVHEHLYRNQAVDRVEFARYLRGLCGDLEHSLAGGSSMTVVVDAMPAEIAVDEATPLGLIVTELVCNALKYGQKADGRGTVQVKFRVEADGHRRLTVTDDGPGLPEGFNPRTSQGLGMRLVTGLIDQLKGRLKVLHTSRGTGFSIELPKPANADSTGKG
jgi:PAS domain S-box-containing protein